MRVQLARPWLIADLGRTKRAVSWALNRPGFVSARHIVWREVRNADLPEDLDAAAWFRAELAAAGHGDAIGFLTSRNITRWVEASAAVEGVEARVLATVGLSNAERVGARLGRRANAGTINIAVDLSGEIGGGLTEAALLETLSIAAQARTAAVMRHGPKLQGGAATGTGTDCIAVAAPPGPTAHAGLHTPIGHAVGHAVLDAVARGVQDWMTEQGD